jgi:hypothetical protein
MDTPRPRALAVAVSLLALAGSVMPHARAQSASAADQQNDSSIRLTGGVDQKETITMPGSVQASNKEALPKFTLMVPVLDTTPSVPKSLQAGATFNKEAESDINKTDENVWYKIPNFMAGTWQCSEKTITSSTNLETGNTNHLQRTEEFISGLHQGFQQDSQGTIWQYQNAPFLGHSIGPNDVVHYSYVQLIQPLSCSNDRFVRRTVLTLAQVNGNQIVESSKQAVQIQAYTPLGPDQLREDTLSRQLDANGKAVRENTVTVIFSRTKPFRPVDRNPKGYDMKALFCKYLVSQGMDALVPK